MVVILSWKPFLTPLAWMVYLLICYFMGQHLQEFEKTGVVWSKMVSPTLIGTMKIQLGILVEKNELAVLKRAGSGTKGHGRLLLDTPNDLRVHRKKSPPLPLADFTPPIPSPWLM